MDEQEALHVAVRHYCIDRARHWRVRYFAHINDKSEPPPYGFMPRAKLLDAVLTDIESVVPSDFATLDSLRDYLLLAGYTAQSTETKRYMSVAMDVMDDARERYGTYVRGLTPSKLLEIMPLPFRRVIGKKESARLWHGLDERWNTGGKFYWYPLKPGVMPLDVMAFQSAWFQVAVSNDTMRTILAANGIFRLWEFNEHGAIIEIDLMFLDVDYDGDERYWTAGTMDWLLYASHESSITVAGNWLIEAVKAEWPEWESHLYTGYDYEWPPNLSAEEE